ncbi:RNA polymerase factor sigma-54 [Flavobacteriales bacterium]|nr:RNA polymerase factor sigma-54 [Flavobacteriales bacterium]
MNKQRLQQKNQQNLSPLQIQFLSLLQIPIVSLEKRIEQELEENPALEEDENQEGELDVSSENSAVNYQKNDFTTIQIEDKEESLSNHLHQQLIAIDIKEDQRGLISYLINSLDDSGFLNRKIHAISSDLLVNNELDVTEKELLIALRILQQLEPFGVGAQDLQECLLIQLKKLYPENGTAFTIINDYYTPFTNKNFEHITKNLNISIEKLKEIYLLIEKLNPIPGRGFSKHNSTTEFIDPDFTILIKNNKVELQLNKNNRKPIRVSKYYSDLLEKTTDEETKLFLKQKVEKAKWFKDALVKRETTLKKVMDAIISLQKAFFLSGNEKDLIPMKLADIAQIVNMDISTISRVSNSKYVETYFGTFKLKDLFSEAYRKDNGQLISTKEIKSRLKELIDMEDATRPFTDEELSELLGKDEYHIARRTVSKYRENIGIQTAKLRRQL